MTIVLLTGPAASGKSTVACSLAERDTDPLAIVEVDQLRHMIVAGSERWEGEEGRSQQLVAARNATVLAQNFDVAGFHVLIVDTVTDATAAHYRQELPVTIVRLLPNWEQTMIRAHSGHERLRFREREALYQQQKTFTGADHTIDNSTLPPNVVASRLERLLQGRSLEP